MDDKKWLRYWYSWKTEENDQIRAAIERLEKRFKERNEDVLFTFCGKGDYGIPYVIFGRMDASGFAETLRLLEYFEKTQEERSAI